MADEDAGAPVCGKKPLPDCPLQAWMKDNASPPVLANDGPKLGAALDDIVGFAPAGYPRWASIAKDGASAARSGDVAAAKAACRSCHEQYRDKYRAEMRARKI
jgi:cytochrome c553